MAVKKMEKTQMQSWWNNAKMAFPFNNRGEVVVATPEKFKIKYDGQDLEVTKDELINLAQQGKDYTQNMQKLSKDRETLKAEEARVAGMKSIVDEMDADPKLKDTLNKVYTDYKSGKTFKSGDTKDKSLNKLDKLIDESNDSDTREQLRNIREIIRQEAPLDDVKSLKETVASLREEISIVKNAAVFGQTDRVESQLLKLEEKFGTDLVAKYKRDIMAAAIKFPNQSANKILYHFADDSEIETAFLDQAKKKEKVELDKKKLNSSPGGQDNFFAAKTPLAKDKAGRISYQSLGQRILERLGKK